jgi:uncharacterized protein with GYD domain
LPYYLSQWIYKDTTFRRMILEKDEENRQEVVRVAIEAFNGRLLNFFYCFGEYDGMCISEFVDNETAQACLMSVLGQGNVDRVRTTPLLTQEEMNGSIQKARHVIRTSRDQVPLGEVPPETRPPTSELPGDRPDRAPK